MIDLTWVLADTQARRLLKSRRAMKIAADICVYSNHNITVEMLEE